LQGARDAVGFWQRQPNPMAHTDSIIAMYFQSNTLDRQMGAQWYHNAYMVCVTLGEKYGFHPNTVAGVIAALSPNNKWDQNVEDAETMLRAYCYEIPFENVKVSTYSINKDKARTIIELQLDSDQYIEKVLRGNKTIAFYNCIAKDGNSDTPCIDGHAYNIWNGSVSNLKEVPSMSDKTFLLIQDAYRDAAKLISSVTEKYHSAAQVQAITWVAYRRIHKNLV
jgi:hypothetical protein